MAEEVQDEGRLKQSGPTCKGEEEEQEACEVIRAMAAQPSPALLPTSCIE